MSRAFRLGAFILFSLLIFAGATFWIGSRHLVFSSTYRLYAEFDNAAGLGAGAEVRVAGIPQGTVVQVELPTHVKGKVRVAMDIKTATRQVIKQDSVAAIHSEGLVGDKYVEIGFGSDEAPAVKAGDVIQAEAPIQFADLLKKADGILESMQSTMVKVEDTSDHVSSITAKIDQGQGTVGAMINDKQLYQHASSALSALNEDAEALKHNFLLRGYFKNRGYDSTADLSRHEIQEMPRQQPAKVFQFEARQLFESASTAKLKKGKALDAAGAYLEKNPFSLVVVACRGDGKGDSEKARTLTRARAMMVREYLVQNFKLNDDRLATLGQGKPSTANKGGAEVEVLVYPPGPGR